MKLQIVMSLVVAALLAGCASANRPYEQTAAQSAREHALAAIAPAQFDKVFAAADVDFSQYKAVQIQPLDMSQVKIRESTDPTDQHHFTPWTLTDDDKKVFNQYYRRAAQRYFITKGPFNAAADNSGQKTLQLQAKLVEIAPLAPRSDQQVGVTQFYSRGFGTMTISFSVYDAASHKLLAIAADQRDLGTLWEENNKMRNFAHIRTGFNVWLQRLAKELVDE